MSPSNIERWSCLGEPPKAKRDERLTPLDFEFYLNRKLNPVKNANTYL